MLQRYINEINTTYVHLLACTDIRVLVKCLLKENRPMDLFQHIIISHAEVGYRIRTTVAVMR